MIRPKHFSAIALAAAGALMLSSCAPGGNGNEAENGEAAEPVEGGGALSIYNCEPQNLLPGNSTEVCGSKVLEQLFTGLTSVDYDNIETVAGVASNWESDDNTTWTFELEEGWTFHNGEEITAQTFVDTWNWTVDPDNAQANAGFYDSFLGYNEVVDGEAEELEGVRAIDEYTLEIELVEPFGDLPMMLSYTGFYPLPEEAFEDIDAFENAPVGNGQYQMDGEWVHDVEINQVRYEDWPGEEPGVPERIEWRLYSDVDTAYMDVQSGELDIVDQAPPNRFVSLDEDFGDNWVASETSSFTYLGFPMYQEEFEDVDIRHAVSKAIDRQAILDSIFDERHTAAYSIIPPTLPQGREEACGEACEYDPDAAADLYEQAGGPSELTLYFNSGAGHDDWMEAVANQLQQNLPIDSINFESLEFAQYLDLQESEEITGPYRLGWVLSYPSPQYAMEPIYTTGASSNYFGYASEEFDNLIDEANAAEEGEADEIYQSAEDVLLEDMPAVPLWFADHHTVFSDRIDADSINVDPRTFLRAEEVVVTEQ